MKFHSEEAPRIIKNIEKLITMYGQDGFSVGDSITWADIALFKAFDVAKIERGKYVISDKIIQNVETHPRMVEYLKTRPPSDW